MWGRKLIVVVSLIFLLIFVKNVIFSIEKNQDGTPHYLKYNPFS